MRRLSSLSAAALALAAVGAQQQPIAPVQEPSLDQERFGSWEPKPVPHYSKTPRTPLNKDKARAKNKAASKARTAQRMRAKGKR